MPHGVLPLIEVLQHTSERLVPTTGWLPEVVTEYTGLGKKGDSIRVVVRQGEEPVFHQGPPPHWVAATNEVTAHDEDGSEVPVPDAASVAHFLDGDTSYWVVRDGEGTPIFKSSHIVVAQA
jgi:hypothetical protein